MIKGIIFDFDGLIIDTETPQYRVFNDIFLDYDSELPLSIWQLEVGTASTFNSFDLLESQINRKVNQAELRKRTRMKIKSALEYAPIREGVIEFLNEAKKLNLKIGLASSSNYTWVSNHLKRVGLYHYFECIKTSDDVDKVKPDPDLYIKTAKCLGLRPEQCLAFEDSANGAKAAKDAKMKCIVVPNEITSSMDFGEVEYRINSMSEKSLSYLLNYLS